MNRYEYLESDYADNRYKRAVEELTKLGVDWLAVNVVELNCGTARSLRYLPEVLRYTGNDINPSLSYDTTHKNALLLNRPDEAMRDLVGRIDVLMIFGMGVGTKHESLTIDATFRELIRTRKPKFVTVGLAARWEHPPLAEVQAWPEWAPYNLKTLDINPEDGGLLWRKLLIGARRETKA